MPLQTTVSLRCCRHARGIPGGFTGAYGRPQREAGGHDQRAPEPETMTAVDPPNAGRGRLLPLPDADRRTTLRSYPLDYLAERDVVSVPDNAGSRPWKPDSGSPSSPEDPGASGPAWSPGTVTGAGRWWPPPAGSSRPGTRTCSPSRRTSPSPGSADRVIGGALDRFGRIDTLVNNAGVFLSKPFTEYTADDYALLTGVNGAGFFWLTQRAIAEMATRYGGHVVTITASVAEIANSAAPVGADRADQGRPGRGDQVAGRRVRLARHPGQRRLPRHHPDPGIPGGCLRRPRRPAAAARAARPGQRRGRRRAVPGVLALRHRRDRAHRRRPDRRSLTPGTWAPNQGAALVRPLSPAGTVGVMLMAVVPPPGRSCPARAASSSSSPRPTCGKSRSNNHGDVA